MDDKSLQSLSNIRERIIIVRDQPVLLDRDVAAIYGVETKRVNEALRRNPDKFPSGYVLTLDSKETNLLRSQIATSKETRGGNRYIPTAFTEKGLYMLATILKSKRATQATIEIIETFAAVKDLQRTLINLHNERDEEQKTKQMTHFSEILSDIVLPDLRADETETTIELNFFVAKLRHTVKRKRRENGPDIVEEPAEPYGTESA
ncbi:MAG: ORF6N domain-containing protein [Bacteroidales bacterium]|nr:ORF6N domain-containing protein [Bacteroidales bacterium]MCD8394768.1 ORF6N domain-containing protein [Bacteroidales bacterium]